MSSAVCEAIGSWSNLTELEVYIYQFRHERGTKDSERSRLARLSAAVSRASSLHRVTLHYPRQYTNHEELPDVIKAIGKNNSVKAIRVYLEGSIPSAVLESLSGSPCAQFVQFFPSDVKSHAPTLHEGGDTGEGLKQLPTLPADIHKEIIDLHLWSYLSYDKLETVPIRALAYSQRCRLMMTVSKGFYAITQPLACRFLFIDSPRNLRYFADLMGTNTRLSSIVNTVIIYARPVLGEPFSYSTSELEDCSSLLRALPNIKELSISTYHAHAIAGMACRADIKKLRLVHVLSRVTFSLLNILASMDKLQSLTFAKILREEHTPALNDNGSRMHLTLSNVTSVRFERSLDARGFFVIQNCKFPSVDTLIIEIAWPSPSGHDQEVLSRFPNVRWLKMSKRVCKEHLQTRDDHTALEKIYLHSPDIFSRKGLSGKPGRVSTFFDGIDFGKFKALKEIQLASIDQWPWQDWELKPSAWTSLAQELTQKYGIKITDGSGLPWKARMQQRMGGK